MVSIYDRKGRTISKGIELPLHPIPSHGTSPDTGRARLRPALRFQTLTVRFAPRGMHPGSSNTLQKSSKQCGLPPPSQSYVELFREQAASISLVQIGHIRSKYKERHGTPRQAVLADDGGADLPDSELILDPAIPREALDSLHGFDYAWIISYLHLNRFGNPNATGGHWKAMVRKHPQREWLHGRPPRGRHVPPKRFTLGKPVNCPEGSDASAWAVNHI